MKQAYFDCASGISGDMTLGALIDAGADLATIQQGIDSLGIQCRLTTSEVKKHGFRALKLDVGHEPEHAHRHLHHIEKMIDGSTLSDRQRELAKRIFRKLGEAEAKVHGTTIQKVHFHEVGAVDSIADIVGTAIALDLLGIARIVASSVPTGTGTIEIAHGRCSVPAPATAELLTGIPLAASSVEAELTTPTGAAILAALADSFGPPPAMTVEKIGYGAGQRELEEQPNLLRILVGQVSEGSRGEQVWIVETTLDDLSGELVGYAVGQLSQAGALDVYTSPVQMKKNRPGVILTALCRAEHVEAIEGILFRETSTLGVRRWQVARTALRRQPHQVSTNWGPVDGVVAELSDGSTRFSPEFEACRSIASEHKVALQDVYQAACVAYRGEASVPR